MTSARAKRLILILSILLPVLIAVTPLCRADNYPDISALSRSFVLKDNRQFFSLKDSGYLLVSTDSVKETLITLLDKNGSPNKSVPVTATSIPFVYEKAALADNDLYLAGKSPNTDGCVKVARFRTVNCSLVQNEIDGVRCDFSRGFRAEADGRFYLVTTPFSSEINMLSPFWEYVFEPEYEGARCTGKPVSEPGSSSDPGSSGASSSSSSETSSSSASSSGSTNAHVYVFHETVTVESLQKQLDSEGRSAKVRVTAADGTEITSGSIGTGAAVEVLRNGQVESRVTAVVPGDLTGSGAVTERDSALLYEHITNQKQLTGLFFQAADINGDDKLDTSDMLQIKKLIK